MCKKSTFNIKKISSLLIIIFISFISALIIGAVVIPLLRKLKAGQSILQIGPNWHNTKAGTPTMGGIIFILAMIIAAFVIQPILGQWKNGIWFWAIMLCSLSFGIIGFIDDFLKVVLKQNLGLRARHKFSLQFIAALMFSLWVWYFKLTPTDLILPFTCKTLELGIMFVPFTVFVMLGTVNSVNLTDGLDGLASTVTIFIAAFFAAFAFQTPDSTVIYFSTLLIGALLGFLVYNKFPAKVFMGDTGSLFLGGAIAAMAVLTGLQIMLLIVGFVYVMETLSVIIQVAAFKITGKRVFKMSPLHHHFEMCGWSERKIVFVFSAVTTVLGVAAYFML